MMAPGRPGKSLLNPGVLFLVALAAFHGFTVCRDAFVGPMSGVAGLPTVGSALRGARANTLDFEEQNHAGRLVFGASALILLAKAASMQRRPRSLRTVLQAEAEGKTPLEDLSVGEERSGTVTRVAKIGLYIDIGAEKDALLPQNMVPKDKEYKAGDEITGLKIFEVSTGDDPASRKIRVTLSELPQSKAVGDKVTGKVRAVQTYGVFFDIGLPRDALAPSARLTKKPSDYKRDEEVELEIVSIDGDKVTVGVVGVVVKAPAPSSSFTVGQTVTGTVARVNQQYGVFFDIGGERDALCFTAQLDDELSNYKEGQKVQGLRIAKIDGEKIEVTTRPLSSEAKVGQEVKGMVLTKLQNGAGIFFDAGFSSDVLAPAPLLSKSADEYAPQQEVDLVITEVDGDRVTVSDMNLEDIPKRLSTYIRGQEVTGKVIRATEFGVLVNIGADKPALWRSRGPGATVLPKKPEEFTAGEEVEGLIITRLDPMAGVVEVVIPGAQVVETGVSMSTLKVGDEVKGTVTRSMAFGVFVDIGAERDALYALSQLEKPLESYQQGMVLTGLRISEVNLESQRLGVSMRPTAGEFTVGDEVTGKVSKLMPFGLFVDIGACVDALAPAALLDKELAEYSEGEVLKLRISRLNADENRISVSQKAGAEGSEATITFADLVENKQIKGVIRAVRDYGAFVDIGLGRVDALMPNAMMGEQTGAAFAVGQELEVWVVRVDEEANRVTVSSVEPTAEMRAQRGGRRSRGSSPDSYIPEGFMVPDPKRHVEILGGREDLMDLEPTPWYEWAEKFPGFVKFQEEDHNIVLSAKAFGFRGHVELEHAHRAVVQIPKHLQKADAVKPSPADLVPPIEDLMPNYDSGIKPEIHTKYRQPPLNDPNWRFSPVITEKRTLMKWQDVVDQAGPFVPEVKPGKKVAQEDAGDGD
ncbi:4-hydroxy-3-methylbut-2-enyl diphosphate reductase (HMBPP reductase) [Durusdinium trenchii]|uniref:4-hydroxy-3-methylbut-2-enyl diphosphate reductase (HMBPP reductase) n=1 Tax=Durusdinium trenchii TaxID=1381693 RepID=A0ABP0KN90_9DINO